MLLHGTWLNGPDVVCEIILICDVCRAWILGPQELQQKSAALLQRKEELERRRKQIQKESKKVRDAEDLRCSLADDMSALNRVERRHVWRVLTHSVALSVYAGAQCPGGVEQQHGRHEHDGRGLGGRRRHR